eukprot:6357836-Prymnesium_polylepis.1
MVRSVDLLSFYLADAIIRDAVREVALLCAIRRTHGTWPRGTPRRPPRSMHRPLSIIVSGLVRLSTGSRSRRN